MRQTAGPLNRTWLIIIGLVALLGGALWFLLAAGVAASAAGMASGTAHVFPSGTSTLFNATATAVVLAVIGVILVLLGLAWIVAQIPRKNLPKPYRLHQDSARGISSCSPTVLSDAVEGHVERLPGVSKASSIVRGASTTPELIVRLTATERADIQDIVRRVRGEVSRDFTTALESPLDRLGVQIDVSTSRPNTTSVTL